MIDEYGFKPSSFLAFICRPVVGKALLLLLGAAASLSPLAAQNTTAWNQGSFHVDRAGVVGSSDIILQRPNERPVEAMPLGNGRLGLGVWAQDGYTAQLNRGDTFPHRLSPGQLVLPGLEHITHAADYSARLNLYDGQFEERGGGMTATTYVTEAADVMVVEVTGADPNVEQTAELTLWPPRKPQVLAEKRLGILAETWVDDQEAGASHETFGSLAAITAEASDLHVEKDSPVSLKLTFRPTSDGSFRILVGVPSWRGGDATRAASRLMAKAEKLSSDEHRVWWHNFWEQAALMKLSSSDHSAEYFENLRDIDLFTAAAESRDRFPGAQAGIGDLFSSIRDRHQWGPSAWWHWNLRMQVSANLGAGLFDLNQSYFRLYRDNLPAILAWTRQHMGGRPGICIPETMRFNGQGYENETWIPAPAINCGEDFHPYYNARTLSTGAEVSLWIWRQYLYTDDLEFLKKNYPVMRESARFLLAYAKRDSNGGLHTYPSNAHETKWDVHDPTTDVAAMRALFPAVVEAAAILKTDQSLARELKQAIPRLPQFAIASLSAPHILVSPEAKRNDTILIESHDPNAPSHNTENIGLEPVWPYGLIGDDGPMHALAVRTYLHRPNKNEDDWSADPEQAAHLGLADELRSSISALTERYQAYPSGLASFMGPEFYVEQIGVLADALQSALVQDSGDLVRIAPAWPMAWDADATVYVEHRAKVHVQIHHGQIITVGLETGSARSLRVRNPWPGERVEVIDAKTLQPVLPSTSAAILQFLARAGGAYMIRPDSRAKQALAFREISGTPASAPRSFGKRTIGMER